MSQIRTLLDQSNEQRTKEQLEFLLTAAQAKLAKADTVFEYEYVFHM